MSKRGREEEEGQPSKKPREQAPSREGNDGATDPGSNALVGHAQNINYGTNYGTIHQKIVIRGDERLYTDPPPPKLDLFSILNPILDASHTRNLRVSPPNSRCFPGTREKVIGMILSWAHADINEDIPHILWTYGYAGCGKSAISHAVAERLAEGGRLAASFFFFRGAGDRCRIIRFANTVAHQLAAAFPAAAPIMWASIKVCPGLLSTSTSSLSRQFQELVCKPILSSAESLRSTSAIIVLDGVDECEDREEVAAMIEDLIAFFDKNPLIPLRFAVASRVEDHIHRELHFSKQVQLLNLVEHTSDDDISTALDICIDKEKRASRVLASAASWPASWEKRRLVQRIGGSYIFMTTILKVLFAPSSTDGLTPMERWPQILGMEPMFDGLYAEVLKPYTKFPFFLDIISTIALANQSLSIAEIADILEVKASQVVNVLIHLHAIMQVPGDDHSPVTLWHTSLRDFLCSERRAGPFFASPHHHQRLAYRTIRIAASSAPSPSSHYARGFGMHHLSEFLKAMQGMACFDTLLEKIMPDLVKATFADDNRTALQVACRSRQWNLVLALVNGKADVNVRFTDVPDREWCRTRQTDAGTALEAACTRKEWAIVRALVNANVDVNVQFQVDHECIKVALHAACKFKQKDIIYLLLKQGADPNVVATLDLSNRYPMALPFPPPGYNERVSHGTPLLWSFHQRDADLFHRLLECGANTNVRDSDGLPIICLCARMGEGDQVRALLTHGADVNSRDNNGATPLIYACRYGHPRTVECLLEFGADVNAQGGDGHTPLHLTCRRGSTEATKTLLERGANLRSQNKGGDTPLHMACSSMWASTGMVKLLLERGANPNEQNKQGKTALQCARESTEPGAAEIVEVLLQKGITEV